MWRLATAVLIFLCIASFAGAILTQDGAFQNRSAPFSSPASGHWLGTDGLGRDEFARLLRGTRASLTAGVLAAALSLTISLCAGSVAGYRSGWTDALITHTAEVFQCLPWFYLVVAIRAFLPVTLPETAALLGISALTGLTAWPRPSLLIRGVVMAERRRDYVSAARAFGATEFYLVHRHILPALYGVILVQAVLLLPQFILAEVTLSFLGFGVSEPSPSLGNMLGALKDLHVLMAYPWMLAPGVVLVLVTSSCRIVAKRLHSVYGTIQ